MLTWENDVEAAALRGRGWTISAIARHLGHDRKTIRDYLSGRRTPGRRASSTADPFEEFAEYVKIRLADDPHLWATTLFDEVVALGYQGSYPSFTRGVQVRRLRPHCEPCQSSGGRDHAIIDHPPGRRPSSTGWSCPTHRPGGVGGRRRICWSAPCRTRGSGGRCWPSPRTSSPGRVPRRRPTSPGRLHQAVAVRPDGHRVSSVVRSDHRDVRPGGQALRRRS